MLRDYLLLQLNGMTAAQVQRWLSDMTARHQADGTRDLLAFWRDTGPDGAGPIGPLHGYGIVGPDQFCRVVNAGTLKARLAAAVQTAVSTVRGGQLMRLNVEALGGTGVLTITVALPKDQGGQQAYRDLANTVAYFFEQQFNFAGVAAHPVAHEEALRPKEGE